MINSPLIAYDSPESCGIPQSVVDNFIAALAGSRINPHSLIIMKDDKIITEKYCYPYDENRLQRTFSLTKTFTALAIGLLEYEGKFKLDDRISDYFPEYIDDSTHEYIRNMTIRNCLMMRTCHAATTYDKYRPDSDWAIDFFKKEPTHPAGLMFHYDTSSAQVLCALAEKLAGTDIFSYIRKKIDVLNFSEHAYTIKDGTGVSMGGTGLLCTPADLLKVGYLLLHKGNINGTQYFSPTYMDEITTCLSDTRATRGIKFERSGYGMQLWMTEGKGYCAYGMGGQFVNIYPDLNLAVITTANTIGDNAGIQLIQDSINNVFVAELRKLGLSNNNFTISPAINYSKVEATADNFALQPEVSAETDDKIHTLTIPVNGQKISINFGLGKLVEGKVPFYDQDCIASGSVFCTDSVGKHIYIRLNIIDESLGCIHFDTVILTKEKAMELSHGKSDKGLFVFMSKNEETMFSEYTGHYLFFDDEWSLE